MRSLRDPGRRFSRTRGLMPPHPGAVKTLRPTLSSQTQTSAFYSAALNLLSPSVGAGVFRVRQSTDESPGYFLPPLTGLLTEARWNQPPATPEVRLLCRNQITNKPAPSGRHHLVQTEYVAPTMGLVLGAKTMPPPWGWGFIWFLTLQRGRAYGATHGASIPTSTRFSPHTFRP